MEVFYRFKTEYSLLRILMMEYSLLLNDSGHTDSTTEVVNCHKN